MILTSTELTEEYCETLSEEVIELLCLSSSPSDSDYELWMVEIDGKVYKVIHGFPGDNPNGVFFIDNETYFQFGEGCENMYYGADDYNDNPIFAKFCDLYIEVPEELTSFDFIP